MFEKIEKNLEGRKQILKWKAEQKIKHNGHKSEHAAASAAIKKELASKYPYIKFSVTSDSFSMGDSVLIEYTDGVTSNEIEKITNKYQYGSFNSYEDIYENTNKRSDIPQTKFVQVSRHISDFAKAGIKAELKLKFSDWDSLPRYEQDTLLHRECYKTNFCSETISVNG